jgi:hypothetical protein
MLRATPALIGMALISLRRHQECRSRFRNPIYLLAEGVDILQGAPPIVIRIGMGIRASARAERHDTLEPRAGGVFVLRRSGSKQDRSDSSWLSHHALGLLNFHLFGRPPATAPPCGLH